MRSRERKSFVVVTPSPSSAASQSSSSSIFMSFGRSSGPSCWFVANDEDCAIASQSTKGGQKAFGCGVVDDNEVGDVMEVGGGGVVSK